MVLEKRRKEPSILFLLSLIDAVTTSIQPLNTRRKHMTPIHMMVLAGILMLITAFNLKLAIWYIERKEAKRVLARYNCSELAKESAQTPVSFSLSEVKCVNNIAKNIDNYLDALTSHGIEKIGIIKDDTLVAVMISLDVYEKMHQSDGITYSSSKKEQP